MQALLPTSASSGNRETAAARRSGWVLPKGKLLRLEADEAGIAIRCVAGILWVTQDGLADDILLRERGEFHSHAEGVIVVEALEPAELTVTRAGPNL